MLNTADEVSLECSSADLKVKTILDAFIADYSTEWVYSQKQQQQSFGKDPATYPSKIVNK